MAKQVIWAGNPATCQLCMKELGRYFVDGKTKFYGGWAIMCPACHATEGVGLGLGKGQKYQRMQDKWVKVEG